MIGVEGRAQHYEWGSSDAIPALLGRPGNGRPVAEWWWGTHHLAPSELADGRPLRSVSGPLPFLVKLLAAAQPLSLQTHPSAAQAEEGYAREEAAGIAVGSSQRTYRDPYAKPEILIALTTFEALCGFRDPAHSAELLGQVGLVELAVGLRSDGLDATVHRLYQGGYETSGWRDQLDAGGDHALATLGRSLDDRYPGDPSVYVALLLHHVHLRPGQAVFLPAGNLHAYLDGTGVEVMGASDNVVRGGLTVKHVNVAELLAVVDLNPIADPVLDPRSLAPGIWTYPTPGAPFVIERILLSADESFETTASAAELWLTRLDGDPVRAWYVAPEERTEWSGPADLLRVRSAAPSPATAEDT